MRPTTVWIRLRKCKSARKRKRWRKWRRSWIRMTMRVKDSTMTSLSKWVRSGRCQKWRMFFQTWITRSPKMARVKGITRECSFCDYLVTLFYFTTICRTRLDQRFSHSPETQKAPEHSAPNALPLLTPTEMARSTLQSLSKWWKKHLIDEAAYHKRFKLTSTKHLNEIRKDETPRFGRQLTTSIKRKSTRNMSILHTPPILYVFYLFVF